MKTLKVVRVVNWKKDTPTESKEYRSPYGPIVGTRSEWITWLPQYQFDRILFLGRDGVIEAEYQYFDKGEKT